jgi:parvulin-like peptidyl-prolyl isomerase
MMWLTLALAALAQDAQVIDRIAAVVADRPIALSEVYDLGHDFIQSRCSPGLAYERCLREAELEVLDTLIKFALVKTELDALNMRVTGEDVDRAIDNVIRENGFTDRQDLRTYVESTGARWESYREQLKDSMRTDRFRGAILAPQVVITDDEIQDLYQRTKRKVDPGKQKATLDAIGLVLAPEADEAERAAKLEALQRAVAALNAGELAWPEAVQQYDTANLAGVVAGRTYEPGQLQGNVDTLLFSAEVGVVNEPVVVGDVIFVVKVTSRDAVDPDVQSLEEVREQLRAQLFQQKLVSVEEEWYQRARRESAVSVLLTVD